MLSFDKYSFSQNILKSIKELKFNKPTPIQSKVIPQILSSEIDFTIKLGAFPIYVIAPIKTAPQEIANKVCEPEFINQFTSWSGPAVAV